MNMSVSMFAAILAADARRQMQHPSASGPYPTGEGEARARLRDREQAQRQRELYADTPAPRLTRQQRRALERQTKGSARGSTLEVSGDLTLQSAASSPLPQEER